MVYVLAFEVTVGNGPPRRILTRETSVTIGRGRRAVVQSQDRSLEDLHSVVYQRDDGTVVLLNYSRECGTLLNGEPTQSAVLHEGDSLRCGDTVVKLLERRAPERRSAARATGSAIRDFVEWARRQRLLRR